MHGLRWLKSFSSFNVKTQSLGTVHCSVERFGRSLLRDLQVNVGKCVQLWVEPHGCTAAQEVTSHRNGQQDVLSNSHCFGQPWAARGPAAEPRHKQHSFLQ